MSELQQGHVTPAVTVHDEELRQFWLWFAAIAALTLINYWRDE